MKSPWVVLALLVLAAFLLGLLLPAAQMESKLRMPAQHLTLHRIGVALHNYHDVHNSFPPAIVYNDKGEKLYSWRVLLLPYMVAEDDDWPYRSDDWDRSSDLWDYFQRRRETQDARRIYDQIRKVNAEFDRSQAWDSPANRHLSEMNFEFYRRPNSGIGATTDYFAVTSQGIGSLRDPTECSGSLRDPTLVRGANHYTAWPLDRPTRFGDFIDGSSMSIMIVEGGDEVDVCWAEPRDLEFDKLSFKINGPERPGIFGRTDAGAYIARADGSVELLSSSTKPETVKSLLLINDAHETKRQEKTKSSEQE